jgi:hypothetical protein
VERPNEGQASNWIWIGGAAIATFLIASVLPTAILQTGALLCLDVGLPSDACMAPFHGTVELTGSQVTGLTMSMTATAKIVLSLVVAGITALVMRREPT